MPDDDRPLMTPPDLGGTSGTEAAASESSGPDAAADAIPAEAPTPSSPELDDDLPAPVGGSPVDADAGVIYPAEGVSAPTQSDESEPESENASIASEGMPAEADMTELDVSTESGGSAELGPVILERLESLQRYIVETAGVERHQATLIEKLHAENVTLRQGELTQALKPLILDLARLHDDVAGVIERGGEELQKAAVIPDLILDVLDRHGVSQIKPPTGEPFDGKQHQGVKAVTTADPSQDGIIESVVRPGFIRDGAHLVRPAQVTVYRYVAPPPEEEHVASDMGDRSATDGSEPVTSESISTTEQPGSNELG